MTDKTQPMPEASDVERVARAMFKQMQNHQCIREKAWEECGSPDLYISTARAAITAMNNPASEASEVELVARALTKREYQQADIDQDCQSFVDENFRYRIGDAEVAIAAMRHQKPVSLEAENKRLREALKGIAAECKSEWWKYNKKGWDCDTPGIVIFAYNKAQSATKQESSE